MELLKTKIILVLSSLILVIIGCTSRVNDSSAQSNCKYTEIETALQNKDTVFKLYIINDSRYNGIPSEVFTLNKLKVLSFTGSRCDFKPNKCINIDKIPSEIKKLTNLEELYLVSNDVKKIPLEINSLGKLRVFDLSDNTEIDISNLNNKSLEQIFLNGCCLQKLPENLKPLKNLKVLGVKENRFNDKEKERIKCELPNVKIYF